MTANGLTASECFPICHIDSYYVYEDKVLTWTLEIAESLYYAYDLRSLGARLVQDISPSLYVAAVNLNSRYIATSEAKVLE